MQETEENDLWDWVVISAFVIAPSAAVWMSLLVDLAAWPTLATGERQWHRTPRDHPMGFAEVARLA